MEEEKKIEQEIVEQKKESVQNEELLKLKRSNEKKKAVIVVLVFAMIIMLVLLLLYYFNNKDNDKPKDDSGVVTPTAIPTPKYTNTFKYSSDGSYGIAYATGYVEVKKEYYCEAVPVAECNESNAEEVNDVVYFHVTETESEDLKKEINEWFGEQSKDAQSIQLGCVKNDSIEFVAFADDFYHGTSDDHKNSPEYYANVVNIDIDNSNKIISSNENNLITIKFEKLKYSAGFATDGYTCLSRMASVEIVD